MRIKFAAFIMTYERPKEVLQMISKLREQTLPPDKILVVDNSSSLTTQELINESKDSNVDYYRVGHNSGPAGAAHIGLKRLTEEGYEWIYWGDDDDPPSKQNDFESLFGVIERAGFPYDKIGIIGKRAGKFNRLTARTSNFANRDLKGIMEADYVPGNHVLLVNALVIRRGVFPSKQLFFGFEELDFCLQVKRAGFKILFDADAILKDRIREGKVNAAYKWRGKSFGEKSKLWRQYYSTRNILKILTRNKLWVALCLTIAKTLTKSIVGFRFGWRYGKQNFRIQILALVHFFLGRYGKANLDL